MLRPFDFQRTRPRQRANDGKFTAFFINHFATETNYFAEIWVNDKLATYRPWPPFQADITECVKQGENEISIVVSNLLANKAGWDILDANITSKEARWWHDGSLMREKDKLISGLLGPVRITPLHRESIEIKFE